MKTQYLSGVVALIAIASFATQGQAAPLPETTDVIAYSLNSPYAYFGGVDPTRGDFIGPFDTSTTEVILSGHTLEFKFLTQYDGAGLAHYADLFIASNPLNSESYDYGVSLGFQGGNGGVGTIGLYKLAAGDLATSLDIWSSRGGFVYGGKYVSPNDNLYHDAPTVVTGGTLQDWGVTATSTFLGPNQYLMDIVLEANTDSAYSDVFGLGGISAFWGTGDCSNDAVYLTGIGPPPHTQSTPEPATMLLFGSGLLGFGGLRRRLAKR